MHWGIAAFIMHIPFFHLWLHALLPVWKKFPIAFYAWIAASFVVSFAIFPTIDDMSVQFFSPTGSIKLIGIGLMLVGASLSLWSFLTLGPRRFFAYEVLHPRPQTKLIKDGPFRYWPHPSYTGYLLVARGNFLSSGKYYLLVALVILLFLTPVIIWLEDQELGRRLGVIR